MHRALTAASRGSALSAAARPQASRLRQAGVSLQQQRFAHKVSFALPARFDPPGFRNGKLTKSLLQELKFGVEGRASLLKGVETLSKAVGTTLGPKGRNVLIESPYGAPKITKGSFTTLYPCH